MSRRLTTWLKARWAVPSNTAWFFGLLPPVLVAAVWLAGTFKPMILFAHHDYHLYAFRPLDTTMRVSYWRMLLGDKFRLGFYKGSIFVNGACCVCGDPYAPPGTLVFAALPKGLAAATREPGIYDHLSDPRYLRYEWAFLASLLLGRILAIPAARLAKRKRKGICANCAYDLRGNVSGVCPECGTPCDAPREAV
ncbi:MAG: hypothetical protein J5J06_13065 [Phycisphaerae bacterium]|nr:hypothetical protein [Phycisphaerae bacterium]